MPSAQRQGYSSCCFGGRPGVDCLRDRNQRLTLGSRRLSPRPRHPSPGWLQGRFAPVRMAVEAPGVQSHPAPVTGLPSPKLEVRRLQNAAGELHVAAFVNDPGAFHETSDGGCRVPAPRNERGIVLCKCGLQLYFPKHASPRLRCAGSLVRDRTMYREHKMKKAILIRGWRPPDLPVRAGTPYHYAGGQLAHPGPASRH